MHGCTSARPCCSRDNRPCQGCAQLSIRPCIPVHAAASQSHSPLLSNHTLLYATNRLTPSSPRQALRSLYCCTRSHASCPAWWSGGGAPHGPAHPAQQQGPCHGLEPLVLLQQKHWQCQQLLAHSPSGPPAAVAADLLPLPPPRPPQHQRRRRPGKRRGASAPAPQRVPPARRHPAGWAAPPPGSCGVEVQEWACF